MKAIQEPKKTVDDPCLQIQADLSAMVDGELDPKSVRRVMVHSDLCPSCRGFLENIRAYARTHQNLHAILTKEPEEVVEIAGPDGEVAARVQVAELRRQLTENRVQLARIFYELGRGFILMGLSPNFSRIVGREPVPIPDMFQRGRNLVDEVERQAGGPQRDAHRAGAEWVRAKALFGGDGLRSPAENLAKGKDLLREALMLAPDYHEARIYLGHAHHVAVETEAAVREFEAVLEQARDSSIRAFALLNLGNVRLDQGQLTEAVRYFLEIVESGIVQERPQFGWTYFNLALVYGLQEKFQECAHWLGRLYSELPHKRRIIAQELRSRDQLREVLDRRPDVQREFASRFPCWFPIGKAPRVSAPRSAADRENL